MREILFRAKQHYTKEWLYGAVVKDGDECLITVGEPDGLYRQKMTVVEESTVGQFTGLLDKYGRKIFEGDIVVTCPSPLSISDGGDISKKLFVDSWVFTDMCHSAMCKKSSKREKFYKIVGNIHDNPELVEAR